MKGDSRKLSTIFLMLCVFLLGTAISGYAGSEGAQYLHLENNQRMPVYQGEWKPMPLLKGAAAGENIQLAQQKQDVSPVKINSESEVANSNITLGYKTIYDKNGNPVGFGTETVIKDEKGRTTKIIANTYDLSGDKIRGEVFEYLYDDCGRLAEKKYLMAERRPGAKGGNNYFEIVRDESWKCTYTTDNNGRASKTEMVYREFGKLVTISEYSYVRDDKGRITETNGATWGDVDRKNLKRITKESYSYNDSGKLAKRERVIKDGTGNLYQTETTAYAYDADNKLQQETQEKKDKNGNTIRKVELTYERGKLSQKNVEQYKNGGLCSRSVVKYLLESHICG